MIRRLTLPDSGAVPAPDAALCAPSALRNRAAILDVLARFAPASGRALELASGTGEHVVAFAPATPGLDWQPSDADPARLASIAAWQGRLPAPNLRPPLALDACAPGWGARHGPVDLIVLVNLLHLIAAAEAEIVLAEIALALAPGGRALIYGPFLRDGRATSPGDAEFDARLRAQDPAIGYKDVAAVTGRLEGAGLRMLAHLPMPANNLMLCAERPG